MKRPTTKQIIHYSTLFAALLMVWLTQSLPSWGETYSVSVYPFVAQCLSSCSRWIPFSLGDAFITLSIVWVIAYPIYGKIKRQRWLTTLRYVLTYLAWVYIWFYVAWGLNYSQPNFYQRTEITPQDYTNDDFKAFVMDYVNHLNDSYITIGEIDKKKVQEEIINQYGSMGHSYGIHFPKRLPKVKSMLFSSLFSKMAVTGYMGPFFCEFNLNEELLPWQYADTYAHELSHFLGISNEAEANLYAYLSCTRSSDNAIRFCGYFSVFGHVMRNAYGLLSEDEYQEVISILRPEVIELYETEREYWRSKYSKTIGSAQDWLYNLYLKGNRIESGMRNYSEVVGLLVACHKAKMI